MHLSFDSLATCLRSALLASLLLLHSANAVAEAGPSGLHLLPRAQLEPVTIPIHTLQRRSPADNTTFGGGLSSVTLTSDRQSYYTVIKAGPFNFRVALDTGSADLWLVSTQCETDTCKKSPRYPLEFQSPTFASVASNATTFNASYADGTSVSGFVAVEAIQLTNLTVSNQTFGVITNSNVSLVDQTSGIMGLGFPRLSSISNSTNSTPFFTTLARQGRLEYPLFAFSLDRNSTGSLTLGAIDSSIVTNTSRIGWNKVAQFAPFSTEKTAPAYLQWAIPLTGIFINGTQSIVPAPTYPTISRNSLALFDVGAPGIYGPYQDVSRIYATIDGARLVDPSGQWAVPCDTAVPMAFTFGLRNYTFFPTDYLIAPVSGNPNMCLSWPMSLPPSSDGIDWQIGAAFLRTVYSIYSFGISAKEPPLIGLYPVQNDTALAQASTPDAILSSISANSLTLATTLPNFLLPTPTFTTPPFALNTSVSTTLGGIVSTGLANGTYTALFGQRTSLMNVSSLPTITPPPTVVTLVVTNAVGAVATSVISQVMMSVTLGLPGASSAGAVTAAPVMLPFVFCVLIIHVMLFFGHC